MVERPFFIGQINGASVLAFQFEYVTIVPATSDLFHRGLSLFIQRPDKEWSLTDCISFTVMQERRLQRS
jgi:predicted nucleic acid-binding protein